MHLRTSGLLKPVSTLNVCRTHSTLSWRHTSPLSPVLPIPWDQTDGNLQDATQRPMHWPGCTVLFKRVACHQVHMPKCGTMAGLRLKQGCPPLRVTHSQPWSEWLVYTYLLDPLCAHGSIFFLLFQSPPKSSRLHPAMFEPHKSADQPLLSVNCHH